MIDPEDFINKSIMQKKVKMTLSPETMQWVHIDTEGQTLTLLKKDLSPSPNQYHILLRAKISTSKNGLGEENGSFKTPRGWHIVRAKIGRDHPKGSVFVGRRWTKEIYSESLSKKYPDRDWILTRVLWLSGIEPGFNRLGKQDTMRRYIYIHGTNDLKSIGKAVSCGCIRMKDDDLIKLFGLIKPYDQIFID